MTTAAAIAISLICSEFDSTADAFACTCHETVLVNKRPSCLDHVSLHTGCLPLAHAWPGTLLVKDGTHAAHKRFFETACALSPEQRSGLKDWCAPFVPPNSVAWAVLASSRSDQREAHDYQLLAHRTARHVQGSG